MVTIEAESSTVDLYIYLLSGASKTGSVIAENDDLSGSGSGASGRARSTGGSSHASGIERRLSAGTYTAEVTTNETGKQSGAFSLNVQTPVPAPTPTPTPTPTATPMPTPEPRNGNPRAESVTGTTDACNPATLYHYDISSVSGQEWPNGDLTREEWTAHVAGADSYAYRTLSSGGKEEMLKVGDGYYYRFDGGKWEVIDAGPIPYVSVCGPAAATEESARSNHYTRGDRTYERVGTETLDDATVTKYSMVIPGSAARSATPVPDYVPRKHETVWVNSDGYVVQSDIKSRIKTQGGFAQGFSRSKSSGFGETNTLPATPTPGALPR